MDGTKKHIAFLDTHIVVWLYGSLTKKLTKKAIEAINKNELLISPLVKLELQYLFEIKRIKTKPEPIISSLENSIGLAFSESSYKKITDIAVTQTWTRDPFDRLLVSEALINNAYFITKDNNILKNYSLAIW